MRPVRVAIIGSGIVGLATALSLARRFPQAIINIFEKEKEVGLHQTGHNSGVIHSGIYYRPGSLKARLCIEGAKKLIEFCAKHHIPVRVIGKAIIALNLDDCRQLNLLEERAVANGISGVRKIGRDELREVEPYVQGREALWVPSTAIVDYGQVTRAYAKILINLGCSILTNTEVSAIKYSNYQWVIESSGQNYNYDILVNCAGLFSDRIARLCGARPQMQIIPFRGEYYKLLPTYEYLVKGLIYPVPNPSLPFLGVHFTSMIGGGVEVGPNAVLAFAREGYRKMDFNFSDMRGTIKFPGFWKLLMRYGKVGALEMYRSLSKKAFVKSLQRLVPSITSDMLMPAESGVRAQAVDSSGRLVDDFCFLEQSQALHVLNSPSPAATSSLAIGEIIANKIESQMSRYN